jgi:hypothetical protein
MTGIAAYSKTVWFRHPWLMSSVMRRGNAKLYPRHLRAQRSNPTAPRKERMDCFAALAMTGIDLGAPETRMHETADYPSGVTEILAQSRRPIRTQSWVLRRSAMLTASQMPIAVSATVNASAATLASMR